MTTDDDQGLRRQLDKFSRQVARQQAQIDLLTRRCGELLHENHALREDLRQEREAHRKTKRELAQSKRECQELRARYDDVVTELGRMDARYRAFLKKEFGSSSERLRAIGTMIPEVLEALIDEGCVTAYHRDSDLDSTDPSVGSDMADRSSDSDAEDIEDLDYRDPQHQQGDDGSLFDGLDDCDLTQPGALWQADALHAAPAAAAGAGTQGASTEAVVRMRPANAGGRKPLPEDLERRHEDYHPPADHPDLRHTVGYTIIGYRELEKFDLPRMQPFVTVYRCPVCVLEFANGTTMQQTLAPPFVIERGQASDRFLVQSAVDKVADHLPSYRQEQRLARVGALIPRSKLCRWHIALATFLTVIAEAIRDEVFTHPVIGVDDSVHRQPIPGAGKCRQKRIWAICAPEAVCYQITSTREAQWITAILQPYSGVVMGDGCASHNATLRREDIIALFCWAHARRYFVEAEDNEHRWHMLALIAQLYAVEDACAGHDPPQRVAIRRAHAAPILTRIKAQLDAWHADRHVRPTSGLGRAVTYTLNHWDGLVRYCDIGEAPIDNNATEQCMRPNAMHRGNSLFSVSDKGADAYATLLTLVQSAKLNHLDPVGYLLDVIEDLHYGRRTPAELTPRAYAARQSALETEPVAVAS